MPTIRKKQGSLLVIVVIFGFIMILSLTAISSLLVTEHRLLRQKIAKEDALQVAEAGLNYYRWRLAHNDDDLSAITEQAYYGPSGNLIGYYSVTTETTETASYGARVTICHKPGTPAERTAIIPISALSAHLAHGDYEGNCGTTSSSNTGVIAITAVGWTDDYPNIQRTIKARYSKPSLAQYAFATNSNVWFGDTESLSGLVHSNGGIRMDGTCDSRMTSIKETYICGEEHGCAAAGEDKPGIWGTGIDAQLWDYPVTDSVDFDVITVDLDTIKTAANASGEYFEPSTKYGYLITFSDNGTFDVRKVTKLENPVWSYNGTAWVYDSISYKNTSNVGTYNIPSNGLIFVEDNVWIEGIIDGRATLAAARLPDADYEDANIYIQNDLTYATRDGVTVLGLIAQNDIAIPLYSEDNLVIDAALLAQKGHVFRNCYGDGCYEDLPSSSYDIRNSIQIYGTIISNGVWTFSWVNYAGGPVISGYTTTQTTYDPYLLYAPPPSFPAEDEYEFISWEEINP